jgi:hypothetical protein
VLIATCRSAQQDGIWAWDIEHNEPVLVFPTVLALLGDNPMQSEFACHIGMRGKYFCRMCQVKGTAADNQEPMAETALGGGANSGANDESGIESGVDDETEDGDGVESGKRKGKKVETMAQMKARITEFLEVGRV